MNSRRTGGFALPTVLIASIVMLTVLLVAVTSTAAVRASIKAQYYNQLSQLAGDAGVVYAKACLNANNGVPLWTNNNPLKPGTDCTGTQLVGFTCPDNSTDARCSVMVNDGSPTTFTVSLPELSATGKAINVNSIGSTKLLRSSDSSSWRQYNQSVRLSRVVDPPLQWKQITNGESHTCAIGSDNLAYCWGYDWAGLGNNSTGPSLVPIAVDTTGVLNGKTIKSIASSRIHTCAIASDNLAYCWGFNAMYGQLGNNSTTNSSVPVAVYTAGVLSGKTIKSIPAG